MCICKGCTIGMSDLPDMYVPKHADYRPEDSFSYILAIHKCLHMLQPICNITFWQAESSLSQKSMI